MASERPIEKPAVRAAFFVEAVPYFLLGATISCAGLVSLVLWSQEQWSLGHRRDVVLVCALAAALAAGFIVATRAKRSVLLIAVALMWCGLLVYFMVGFGIRIPLFGG